MPQRETRINNPTAYELFLYRIRSPDLSQERKDEIKEFLKDYPSNNASAERFDAFLKRDREEGMQKYNL